jgi:2-keto-3-deoxy-L-rhamnonate aldolase RhmA
MTLLGSETLNQIRSGQLTLSFGVQNLRGVAVPLLAKAAGYDWLFIDAEHGSISSFLDRSSDEPR